MRSRVFFDIYGRFRVVAEAHSEGAWTLFRIGADGKRSRLRDVIVPVGATVDDVEDALAVTFHEEARPGASIIRLDL